MWYQAKGCIKRNKHAAGVRFSLIRLAVAKNGYYPAGMSISEAFKVSEVEGDGEELLNFFTVVFEKKSEAKGFLREVDSYVTTTRGISLYNDGQCFEYREIPLFDDPTIIWLSHYAPRKAEGEDSALDSPPWDVEYSSVSMFSAPSRYSRRDTVYKYQRIEVEQAFARCAPQGAHIFPKAKCKGKYEWLDKQLFNRLAMSLDGHEQFDGTGRGRGISAETSPQVALQPERSVRLVRDGETFTRIEMKLWCRNKQVALAWRSALREDVSLHEAEGHCYYTPTSIFCRSNRTYVFQFEVEPDPYGTSRRICVTAIPGVDDPSTLSSWNEADQTVAVAEIMECLLRWNYEDVRRNWRTVS